MTDTQAWETKLIKTVDLSIEDGYETIDKRLVFLSSFYSKLLKLTTDAAAAVTVCHGTCLQCKYFKCKMYLMFSSQMHFSLEPMANESFSMQYLSKSSDKQCFFIYRDLAC